jgi:hypothetical protein
MKTKEFQKFYIDFRAIYLKTCFPTPDMSIIDMAFRLYQDRTTIDIINEEKFEEFLIDKFACRNGCSDSLIYSHKNHWHDDFDGGCHFKVEVFCNEHDKNYGKIEFPLVIIDQYKGGQCERDGLTVIRFRNEEDLKEFVNNDTDISSVKYEILNVLDEITSQE